MEPLVDTHCHIHDSEYDFIIDEVLAGAEEQGLAAMICVGTSLRSSFEAVEFAGRHGTCHAAVGIHPHAAAASEAELERDFSALTDLAGRSRDRLVAVGECGLDYFYHSDPDVRRRQAELFRWHLKLAADLELPLIFHVRRAFEDFWPLYETSRPSGVLHSFSDAAEQVDRALETGRLYFGLNGIMTFSKDAGQLAAARAIPADRLLLETDAPYLTPVPFRGKINKPEYLRFILDFLARLRGEEAGRLAAATTANARSLFNLPSARP
ncbi:TatD family deoxyribonuclease [Candidatus Saccharibacteria bacterium]|nr:TatD family deoxyribonuclease [Candidatus Saccharibacteria bacterium]